MFFQVGLELTAPICAIAINLGSALVPALALALAVSRPFALAVTSTSGLVLRGLVLRVWSSPSVAWSGWTSRRSTMRSSATAPSPMLPPEGEGGCPLRQESQLSESRLHPY